MNGLVLKLFAVIVTYPVRLGNFFAEKRSQVLNVYAVLLGRFLTHSLSGDGVGRKVGTLTFQKVGDADAEGKRAFVDKCEGEVKLTRFIFKIIVDGYFGLFGHFLYGQPDNFTHFANSAGNLQKLFGVYICHFRFLPVFFVGQ